LGERQNRTLEAVGSIPISSIENKAENFPHVWWVIDFRTINYPFFFFPPWITCSIFFVLALSEAPALM
jgi:hypothetical protein